MSVYIYICVCELPLVHAAMAFDKHEVSASTQKKNNIIHVFIMNMKSMNRATRFCESTTRIKYEKKKNLKMLCG